MEGSVKGHVERSVERDMWRGTCGEECGEGHVERDMWRGVWRGTCGEECGEECGEGHVERDMWRGTCGEECGEGHVERDMWRGTCGEECGEGHVERGMMCGFDPLCTHRMVPTAIFQISGSYSGHVAAVASLTTCSWCSMCYIIATFAPHRPVSVHTQGPGVCTSKKGQQFLWMCGRVLIIQPSTHFGNNKPSDYMYIVLSIIKYIHRL